MGADRHRCVIAGVSVSLEHVDRHADRTSLPLTTAARSTTGEVETNFQKPQVFDQTGVKVRAVYAK